MSSTRSQQAAVLGAGSWGTALAVHLASVGHDVSLWGRDEKLIAEMRSRRANPTYLPDVSLPDAVRPTTSLQEALEGSRHVIIAVPSHGLRGVKRRRRRCCAMRARERHEGIEGDSLSGCRK
jgi:glycerol-3-phosphate dehydrogenase (NAD(P)+)